MIYSERDVMINLIDKPYSLVKTEVEEMTQEDAKKIWAKISHNFNDVCMRSGTGRNKAARAWTSLMRKMSLIESKAEAS